MTPNVRRPDLFICCQIRCESGASKAIYEKVRRADCKYPRVVTPYKFKCGDCHVEWSMQDFDGYSEPELVTCSQCYGNHVVITHIRVQDVTP